ncbi:outer membrane protein assembly factor BamB family protein [Haloferax gibbonsii]|uniref:Transcriptional regulator n=1 Tax=Haloferax gibbonsii TaxID=35746 RepID=A0A0K1IXS2_HALGI|nr:PQQ-binding-like beta-propeller repeat protein [Haloferax gibbonsii]AKU09251.1 transcriptional regulator [Haloferax gibbonsii]
MAPSPLTARRDLGEVEPASSRHNWARSAVEATADAVFVGTADGRVVALETATDATSASDAAPDAGERWRARGEHSVVSMAATDDALVVGERGGDGLVRVLDAETGVARWTYATADDVGTATKDSLFFRPYVVDLAVTGDRVVVAARRYERDGEDRAWRSVVLGFDRDGRLAWRRHVHASPIAVAAEGDRVAVAYNRCPNPEQDGLVLLDAHSGARVASWDPDTDGDRRVGDVGFAGDAVAVASHGDKRGYLIDFDGETRWRLDLATERRVGDETVYAYPNHVCVADGTAVFVTGNTFAESTRDPDARHPDEHTAVGVSVDEGERLWTRDTGGFARAAVATCSRAFVPSAQHFREREAERHGVHVFAPDAGHVETEGLPGIPTAVAAGGGVLAVVEEPVEYHDEGVTRGAYRLRTRPIR